MRTFFCSILLLLSGIAICSGRNYYFSNTGNNSADGLTPATAWRLLYMLPHTNAKPGPGDSILLHATDTFSESLSFGMGTGGTAAHPLVISTYGAGRAVLDGRKVQGEKIWCNNVAGIVISRLSLISYNIEFGMYDSLGVRRGPVSIDSIDADGGAISIVADSKDNTYCGYDDISITNCVVRHAKGDGIFVAGTWGASLISSQLDYANHRIRISYCKVLDCGGSGYPGAGPLAIAYATNAFTIVHCDSVLIEHCEAGNNGWPDGGGSGFFVSYSAHVRIEHCESHHQHGTEQWGGGFTFSSGVVNSRMAYNYSHDNDGPAYRLWWTDEAIKVFPWHHDTICYNISENDARALDGTCGALAVGRDPYQRLILPAHDGIICNNTFYLSRVPGPDSMQPPALSVRGYNGYDPNIGVLNPVITNLRIVNNIFYLDSTDFFVYKTLPPGLQLLNNCYWSSTGKFRAVNDTDGTPWYADTISSSAAWMETTRLETGSGGIRLAHLQNPGLAAPGKGGTIGNTDNLGKLAANYGLLISSPLIDSGLNISAWMGSGTTRDFFGNAAPQHSGYDIGAAEYLGPLGVSPVKSGSNEEWIIAPNPCHDYIVVSCTQFPITLHFYEAGSGRLIWSAVVASPANAQVSVNAMPSGHFIISGEDKAAHHYHAMLVKY